MVPWVIKYRHSIWFTMLKPFGVRVFLFWPRELVSPPHPFFNNRSFKDKNPMTFSRVIWNLGQNVTVLPDGFLHRVTGDSMSMVNRVSLGKHKPGSVCQLIINTSKWPKPLTYALNL